MLENNIKNILISKVTQKRYIHSLNVADQAVILAKIYDSDPYKANIASLAHDILKNENYDNMLLFINKFDIMLDSVELSSTCLWHSIIGAEFAKYNLGIYDQDVLNAIRYHTTGRKEMSLLEKIIFVADCTSADRQYAELENLRELSYKSIDDALILCLKYVIIDLLNKNRKIHPNTIDAYNFLLTNIKEKVNETT